MNVAISGAVANALANAIVIPLDVAKTRRVSGPFCFFPALARIIILVLLCACMAPEPFQELLLNSIAAACSQLTSLPLSVAASRQQVDPELANLPIHKLLCRIALTSPTSLWSGLNASIVLCINPAITYTVFERIKALFPRQLTSIHIFVIGALAKALATIITYPYILAKVRMQVGNWSTLDGKQSGNASGNGTGTTNMHASNIPSPNNIHKSPISLLKAIYKTDGFFGLYKGLKAQLIKAVLCQAILFVIKEKISIYTDAALAYAAHSVHAIAGVDGEQVSRVRASSL